MQLANPGNSDTSPACISNAFPFEPTNSPAGGWEIQNMPQGVTFEVKQGPVGGLLCGPELILQVAGNGCYDLPKLANTAWWDFCNTGSDCSEPQAKTKRSSQTLISTGLKKDGNGEYMIAANGQRIPVFRQAGVTNITASDTSSLAVSTHVSSGRHRRGRRHAISKRQQNTFTPPDGCTNSQFSCTALADSGSLVATCVNCVTGFGQGSAASASVDCRASNADCPVTLISSVATTDTISVDITFGATIGDTGKDGASGTATFGLGVSFATTTTHGTNLGLQVPAGHIGFVQYQPPAVLGTVVTSQGRSSFCNGGVGNMICGASAGILATTKDDTNGQYSIVLTS